MRKALWVGIVGLFAVTGCIGGNDEYTARDKGLEDGPNRDVCTADEDRDGDCVEVDCDDADAHVGPSSPELSGDGIDNDCDGVVDEVDGHVRCAVDTDCPRAELCLHGTCEPDLPCRSNGDCAEGEACDGGRCVPWHPEECATDADCPRHEACFDGLCAGIDPECTDADRDGVCAEGGDCDDENPAVHPHAEEVVDGLDNDCDGEVDDFRAPCEVNADCRGHEACVEWVCRELDPVCTDADGDGACAESGDCDDEDASVHPYAEEVRDGVDNDCDGQVDEGDSACHADSDCGPHETCVNGVCGR